MNVKQTNIFKRRVKKLHKREKLALDKAIGELVANPTLGEMKTGDLAGVQVFKYKFNTQRPQHNSPIMVLNC